MAKIGGQFIALRVDLIDSPAFRAMSLGARRALDRICVEHARHGGKENGSLPVTYDDFEVWGIDRHGICPALDELCALGLIEMTPGRAGNAAWCRASRFRITFLPTKSGPPTDEWRVLSDDGGARQTAKAARAASSKSKRPAASGRREAAG